MVGPVQRRTLILHVGHGKTGSSFLQSSLALSQSLLKEEGIDYPEHIGMTAARQGRITSGNLPGDDWAKQIRSAASRSSFPTLLFSNEGLFWRLPQKQEDFSEITNEFKVRIVLFIRNPHSHMRSGYMQSIKRGGNAGSLEEYASQYNMPVSVTNFLQFIKASQTTLDVINYSNHKHELLPVFARVLGVASHRMVVPPVAIVNRALTPAELEIQRLFNLHFGRESSSFVSDVLCNELPDLPVPPFPGLAEPFRETFVARMQAQIQAANAHLPETECYQADFEALPDDFGSSIPAGNESPFVFSRAQLKVLAQAISQKLKSSGVQT